MFKYENLTPFQFFCCNNFPFIEETFDSLNTYKMLCKIVGYLQDEIIPNVDNIGNSQNEVIEKFNELKSFVDNYFENLDVQEEINNKLDEMTEDGTLQEIISLYLNSIAIFGFNTVNDLKKATNLMDGSFAKTLGYSAINDGGSSLYKIRKITNDDIVDNAFIIPLNNDSLIAEIITVSNTINPAQLGCTSNSSFDSSPILQKAINKDLIINGNNKSFNVLSTLNLKNNSTIKNCNFIGNSDVVFITSDSTPYLLIENCTFTNFNKALSVSCYYSNFRNLIFTNCNECLYFVNGTASSTLVENNIDNIKCHNCGRAIYTESGNKLTDMTINNIIAYGNDDTKSLFHINGCAGFSISNIHTYGSCSNAFTLIDIFKSNLNNIYIESYTNNAMYLSVQTSCNISNLTTITKTNKNTIECDKSSYNIEPCAINFNNVNINDGGQPTNIIYSGTSPIVNITNINYNENYKLNGLYVSNNMKVFNIPTKINANKQLSINDEIIKANTNLNITGTSKSITLPFSCNAYTQRLLHAKFTYITYLGGTTATTIESDIIVSRVDENKTNIVKTNNDMPIVVSFDKDSKEITVTYNPPNNTQYGVLDINY